jgi:predicted anti-sigma-YlaC factor YlaD
MSCEQSEMWMMDALDGTIEVRDHQQLMAHLDACARCRADWKALNAIDQMLASQPLVLPEPGFVQRVEARVEHFETQRRTLMGGMILLGSAAALCVVAALLLLNGRNPIQAYGNFLWDTYHLLGHVVLLGYRLLSAVWFTLDVLSSSVNIPLSNAIGYAAALVLMLIAWQRSMASRRVFLRTGPNGH